MTDEERGRRILAGLDDRQHEAVTSPDAPLLVVAGAGSGKTRVLSRRIAWRALEDDSFTAHALALTFTRRAAAELRFRLKVLGVPRAVTAGTFHAIALAELLRRALDTGRPRPVVLDAKLRLVGHVLERAGTPARHDQVVRIAAEIDWAKARRITPEHYLEAAQHSGRIGDRTGDEVALAYRAYEFEKRKRGVLDLDDLLERLIDEIDADVDFAAAQRWRFRHFFVDELQDANPAQLALLDCWLGGRPDLFGVGDPRQSIYGWNGSDPSAISEFTTRHPGAKVLLLESNYRSTPEIVAVASSVLAADDTVPFTPRDSGVVPTLVAYPDEGAEAAGIASTISAARHSGHDLSQFAVLARTNAQLRVLEAALLVAKLGVFASTSASFFSRPVIRDSLALLRRGDGGAQFSAWVESLEDATEDGGPKPPLGREELLGRKQLAELALQYRDLDPRPSGAGFVEFLRDTVASEGAPADSSGIALLTFHRAKGLEWPVVFVTGLEHGLVPISQARTDEQLAEEQRLLYVAMSRASDELHLSWSERRGAGARSERTPSPYLAAIAVATRDLVGRPDIGRSAAAKALSESRSALRRAGQGTKSHLDRPFSRRTVEMTSSSPPPEAPTEFEHPLDPSRTPLR